MINLRTRVAKVREHMMQERLRRVFVHRMASRVGAEFHRVAGALSRANSSQYEAIITQHEAILSAILRRSYSDIFRAFGARVLGMVAKNEKPDQEYKDELDDNYAQLAKRFITKWSSLRSTSISKTTSKRLDTIVANGVRDGLSDREMADQIMERIGGSIGDARALTIARTEAHSASQDAMFDVVQELDVPVEKEWVSVADDRTREDHVEANGQTQPMHEPFDVGDDTLMYPGDPSGEAAQVVNCRCICVYNPVGRG